MDDRKFQCDLMARVWFEVKGANIAASMPFRLADGSRIPGWDAPDLFPQSRDPVEFKYMENFITEHARRALIRRIEASGSAAVRRRCDVCGRVLDVLLLADRRNDDISVLCGEGAFRGPVQVDHKTLYERWCCRSTAGCAA